MRPIHAREYLSAGDVVIVDCSHRCNVRVMDDTNFQNFESGWPYNYHGGSFQKLPARIAIPKTGFWNITIDADGPGSFQHGIRYLKSRAA